MLHDFQIAFHDGTDWPDWGSAPRRPLIQCDGAHKGELLETVIGKHPRTGNNIISYVLKCEYCIAIHLWPLADSENLAYFYREKFFQTSKPQYLEEYLQDKFWWLAVHGTVFDAARPWLPDGLVTMLDIGAGPGYPLEVGAARTYDTTALEPSPVAAACLRERGHEVFEMTLERFMDTTQRACWDLLYAWEVLEHNPEPENMLLQCYDLLKPGGVLVVAVPNDYTWGEMEACRRFNLPPWFVSAPEHQFYFSPKTLQLLFRRCGFAIRYTRMTYPLVEEYMLKQGRCYVGHPTLGRECHHERVKYELGMINSGRWPELEAEYIANVATRTGREVIMIGQKHA